MDYIESILSQTFNASSTMTTAEEFLTLFFALIFGLAISFTYMKTQKKDGYSQSLVLTLTMLPVILAMIIMFVGSNIARAFSLAGTLSIIRFRSAPGEPKDIGFIFFDIASGLACGVGQFLYGALFVAAVCLFMIVLDVVKYGTPKTNSLTIKIMVPEDLDYRNVFDDVFKKYTIQYNLKKVKTAAPGLPLELTYKVRLKTGANDKGLLDELCGRNGNLSVALSWSDAPL